jgi:hypothetical protein
MQSAPEQPECRAWEGFQCGICGSEYKTKQELVRHQFSKHSKPG